MIEFGKEYHPEFDGYVWEKNGGIYLSTIISKHPRQGNLSKLLIEYKKKYSWIKVPTPFALMRKICLDKGFKEEMEYFEEVGDWTEVMTWKKK